jgi:hypothetical protein
VIAGRSEREYGEKKCGGDSAAIHEPSLMGTRILPEEERDWNGGSRSKRTKVKSFFTKRSRLPEKMVKSPDPSNLRFFGHPHRLPSE